MKTAFAPKFLQFLLLPLFVFMLNVGWGQTNNYFGTSGTITGNVWSTSSSGPYTSALVTTGGPILNFNNAGSATGATIATCVGINFGASITWAAGGTIGAAGINLPINVSAGVNQNLTSNLSTAATAAYTKNGDGALQTSGGTYGGGFTLNAGAIIAGGVNAMGGNAIPGLLTLNGGTVAANGNRAFTGKYSNIVIGGNIQFGEMSSVISLASSTSNLTFSNNMSLGSVNRTFTLGNGGNMGFGGIISNTGSNGLTFTANSNGTGRFDITGTNTFSGPVNINGNGTGVAEVRFTSDGSLGNTSNTININGGRLSTLSAASYTLTSGRGIQVGNIAGTSISTPGAGVLTYNGIIADLIGSTPGAWSKQGSGTLSLGGVSTYTGATSINNGTIQLTTGNDRLPTGTVLSLGQAASGNLGTFDLNGQNQTIAGLNSTTGSASALTNVGLNNTITSTAAATLTVSGSGTYGAATDANSGIIAGAISLVKSGSGTLTLGDVNTFTGTTTINGGTLTLSGAGSIASSSAITVGSGGTFDVSGLTTALSLGASQSLKSSATGSNTTATITVASSKGITLSAGGLEFTAYGGGATAPLTVTGASAGSMDLASSPITITTTTALAAGTYKLIAIGGSVTAAVSGTVGALTMGGSGLASGTTGELSIVSGELILTVAVVQYTVTFNGNSNTGGTMSNQTASSATNLTSNSFSRTGYIFGGWATSSVSATVAYADGESYPFTSSTTLYAIWTANTLTVTYDSQGGSVISNGSTTTGGTVSNPGNPTKSGSTFNGWFLASSGGSAISFPYTHGETAGFTLYAQWTTVSTPTINPIIFTLSFTSTYGTASTGISFIADGSSLTGNITATAQSGYEVSTDNSSYTSSLAVSSGTTVYVRFAATLAAGTYNNATAVVLTASGANDANVSTSASGNTVSQKTLSITTATIASKVYNRSTTCGTVTPGALSGFVGSETVVVSSADGTYADWNVGTGKTATIVYTLADGTNGGLAANYSLANTAATGDITAKALTVSSPAVTTKTYDGNTNAFITGTLSGVESGDAVTLSGTGTFASANVGTGSVTSTSTLAGADAGNYSLIQPIGLTGDITGASQTITFASLTPATLSTADYSPGATTSSGLTVTYTSSNPCVASIVGGNIHIIGAGTTTITASQSGGGNYAAASSVSQTLVVQSSFNPTSTLTAGDVALLAINSANPDKFSMVFLKDVAANVAINFTDNGFTATTTTRTGEGFLTYTVPSGGHAAGTVITWSNAMSISGTGWSSNAPTSFAFNGGGDQLFIFSGNTANWSTLSGITLLYGLNYGIALSATSGASNTVQPSTTLLPATSWLNLGTSSYANTYFANATTSTSSVSVGDLASTLLSYFVDGANKWYANSSTAATFPSYSIAVSPSSSPLITTSGTLSDVSTTYGTATTSPTSFSVSSSNLTADLTLTAPSGFEISSGSSYATSLTISPNACGAIAATTISVRLASTTAVGTYSGNIVLSSTGATSVNVATASSSVSTKALTITASNQSKCQEAALSLGTSQFTTSGLVGSDAVSTVTLTSSGSTSVAAAGSYSIVPSAASGSGLSNYNITYTNGSLTVNALPAALSVTGSTYCSYSNLVPNTTYGTVTSTGSVSGVDYSLYNQDGPINISIAGTGSALTWTGVEAATGLYAIGVNSTTGCEGTSSALVEVVMTTATIPLYVDTDGDGYGTGSAVSYTCVAVAPAGYSLNANDCSTSNSAFNPGAVEICGNNIDENCSGNTDDIPAYFRSLTSGNWGDATTWQFACSPSDTYQNSIYAPPANYTGYVNVLNGHTVTVPNNGTIYQTGTLDIDAGGTLTMTGNDYNNDPTTANVSPVAKLTVTLVIINDGTMNVGHQASLVQTATTAGTVNSGSGNFNVQSKLTGNWSSPTGAPNGRYWYIGSPMNNTVASQFFDTPSMVRLWRYNATNNSWGVVIHSQTSTTSSLKLVPGIGYLYRAGANKTITYTSTAANLNNNITTNLLAPASDAAYIPVLGYSTIGYKYVANPYPSHVDWTLLSRTGLNAGYWIRNATNTSYDAYNATTQLGSSASGQTTKYIAPMQGFWVYAYTTPNALKIDNTDRVHSTNVLHAPNVNQVVRLKLNNGESSDYTVVYENELAANDFEEADTDKMFDYDFHQLYTLEGEHELVLNGLSNATVKGSVDMGISVANIGQYTIEATDLEVEEAVILEDRFNHTFQDMKVNPIYSFTTNAGTFNERFVLHFTATESVAVGETETVVDEVRVFNTSNQQVKVWVSNTSEYQGATVKVFDAIGNLVERKNMTSNELLLDLDIANGIYVVEITGANKTFTKKVFITK